MSFFQNRTPTQDLTPAKLPVLNCSSQPEDKINNDNTSDDENAHIDPIRRRSNSAFSSIRRGLSLKQIRPKEGEASKSPNPERAYKGPAVSPTSPKKKSSHEKKSKREKDLTSSSKKDRLKKEGSLPGFLSLRRTKPKQHATCGFSEKILNLVDLEVGEQIKKTIDIVNLTSEKVRWKLTWDQGQTFKQPPFTLDITPKDGIISKGKTVTLEFALAPKRILQSSFEVTLQATTGNTCKQLDQLNVNLKVKKGVFGVDPQQLQMTLDEGLMVPRCIVLLKNALVDQEGLTTVGIFRIAGSVQVMNQIKDQLNKNTFEGNDDIHSLSTLLKVWFRELPVPILEGVSTEDVSSESVPILIEAIQRLPPIRRVLFLWISLLIEKAAKHWSESKMTAGNLAIVFAPNLYEITSKDPMDSLTLSQYYTRAFQQLIENFDQLQPLIRLERKAAARTSMMLLMCERKYSHTSFWAQLPLDIMKFIFSLVASL